MPSSAVVIYRPAGFLVWVGRTLVIAELAGGVGLVLAAPHAMGTQAWVLGIGITVLVFGSLTAVPVWASARRVAIRAGVLRIPAGLRPAKEIPITAITGAGLAYRPHEFGSRAPAGWDAFVWREDGTKVRLIGISYVPLTVKSTPEHERSARAPLSINPWDIDPFLMTDVASIAQSCAGRVITDIYYRAAEAQGPAGPLRTRALQKAETFSTWDMPMHTGFWSPDGTYGRYERRDSADHPTQVDD